MASSPPTDIIISPALRPLHSAGLPEEEGREGKERMEGSNDRRKERMREREKEREEERKGGESLLHTKNVFLRV